MAKKKKEFVLVIEAVVYIISIIVVIVANIYGPIEVRMIPLLFLLGIVGRLAFDRPVSTSVFGLLVSICMVYMSGITNISQNLMISFVMGIYIAIGEVFGLFVKNMIEMLKNKKKRWAKKTVLVYAITIAVLGIVLILHAYIESNFVTYFNKKKELTSYLNQKYGVNSFEIVSGKYQFLEAKHFKFIARNNEEEKDYYFVVYLDEKYGIRDGYQEGMAAAKDADIKEKVLAYLAEKKIESAPDKMEIGAMYLEDDTTVLILSKTVEKNEDNEIVAFSKEVASVLNALHAFPEIERLVQVQMQLISKTDTSTNLNASVYVERYYDNQALQVEKDEDYIKRALKIEYMEE